MATEQQVLDSQLGLRLRNIAASGAIVVLATALYVYSWYNRETMTRLYGPPEFAFTGQEFMAWAAGLYILALAAFYLWVGDAERSKSLRFWALLVRWARAPRQSLRSGLAARDRVAVLSTLLKCFFGPMMVMALMIWCMSAWGNFQTIREAGFEEYSLLTLFNRVGYWFLLQVILFVDVFFFTVGYLFEWHRAGNEIRSVDPTLIGWGAALVCYPPFNLVTGRLLGSTVSDFPQFDDPMTHVALNLALLALMGIYASASASLGWKASNLTHRGIIARGPYAFIRHPAYICKNTAWWIGSMPLIIASFRLSFLEGIMAAGSMAAWSSVYLLRALTEEDHLRSVDGEYAAYAAKVRYRFIPGIV